MNRLGSRAVRVLAMMTVIVLAGCGEDVMGLDDQFLIRRPTDSLLGGAATFNAAAAGTTTLAFEWEPVKGAESYSIIFARTESVDSMNTLRGDLSNPTLTFTVTDIEPVEVLVNPGGDPDGLKVRVIAHTITAAEMHAALVDAGIAQGTTINTIYAVLAHRPSKTIRSLEVQRMNLRRL